MGKRTRRQAADDEEEWDPTHSRPRGAKPRPTLRELSDSDSSQATAKTSSAAAPRKGGRTRVACDQCSKRRSRCSLIGPACDGCIERGDPESCSYQALIWIENVDDLPSRQLRRKLDALEAFLRAVPPAASTVPSPPRRSPARLPAQLPPASPPSEFAPNSVSSSLRTCRDSLARALFANGNLTKVHLPEGVNLADLDFELRQLDNNFLLKTARLPPTSPPSLPTPPQAHLAICFFSSTINPTFRLVFEPIFFRECQEFWATGVVPSPTWLASYLAVCTSGFKVILGDKEATEQSGLMEDEIAHLADKCWNDARDILEGEGFPLSGSLESLQVAITLATSCLYGDASNIARASTLIKLATECALDCNLEIDPRENPASMTPLEVEVRRRTFWALYTCEAMFDLIVGSDRSKLTSWNPTVRRPLYLSNDCYLPSGNLSPVGVEATTRPLVASPTSSLLTVAALSVKVSSIVNSPASDQETQIGQLLDEMDSFDGAFHSSQVADAMFRAAFVRLCQAAKELNFASRDREGTMARHLDALLRSAISPGSSSAPDLSFFATTLSLSTALRSSLVLFDGQITFERNRVDLRNFGLALSSSLRPSALRLPASRCALIFNHVIEQQRRASIEATPSLIGSSLATPNSENAFPSPVAAASFPGADPPFRFSLPNSILANEFDDKTFLPFLDSNLSYQHEEQADPRPPTVPPISTTLRPFTAPARPLLSLRTSVASGVGGGKAVTPVLSPWQDSLQTPSRYIGYAWNQPNLF